MDVTNRAWSSFHTRNLVLLNIKAIYICASERSRYAISGNGVAYCPMTYFIRRYQSLKSKYFVKFLLSQHFFDILIAKILGFEVNGVATPENGVAYCPMTYFSGDIRV